MTFDCAIIGGGPGGLVSALYLRRYRRSVAVINGGKPRASWIPRTHNLLGYHRGISGDMLIRRLQRQVQNCGSGKGMEWIKGSARVDRAAKGFEITVGGRRKIKAKTVILATGLDDVQPEIDNVEELREKELLRYCSICDAFEYRGQPVAVLAKDDAGIQKALFIGNWTKDLRVIVPDSMTLAPQRVRELNAIHAKVTYCKILRMEACRPRKGITIFVDDRPGGIFARVAYIELGSQVRDLAWGHLRKLRRSSDGYLITTAEQRTTIPGIFAVGDCVNLLGQIAVAAGQAAVAATTIHNDLL